MAFGSLLVADGTQIEFKGPGDPYNRLGTAAIFPHRKPECGVATGKKATAQPFVVLGVAVVATVLIAVIALLIRALISAAI